MATLSFSLSPQALIQLHDALICLSKFDETVVMEAEYDLVSTSLIIRKEGTFPRLTIDIQLRLSVLNSSKTSYSAFALDANIFFQDYSFGIMRDASSTRNRQPNKFCCQVYLKVRKL